MTSDTLHGDLYEHLNWWLRECHPIAGPFNTGRSYQWVMDLSWLNECRKLAMQMGAYASIPFVNAETARHESEYLLGLPIEVRDDGGVPHLEAV